METRASWFGNTAPQNCKGASGSFGAGANGVVSILTSVLGEEANDYTFEVVEGVGISIPLSAVLTGKDLVITLGTDVAGVLDSAKNTALLIEAEIDLISTFGAGHSGTGATSVAAAVAKANLTGGQYGTDSPEAMIVVRVWNNPVWDYYMAIAPNGKYDANWRIFNLTEY